MDIKKGERERENTKISKGNSVSRSITFLSRHVLSMTNDNYVGVNNRVMKLLPGYGENIATECANDFGIARAVFPMCITCA